LTHQFELKFSRNSPYHRNPLREDASGQLPLHHLSLSLCEIIGGGLFVVEMTQITALNVCGFMKATQPATASRWLLAAAADDRELLACIAFIADHGIIVKVLEGPGACEPPPITWFHECTFPATHHNIAAMRAQGHLVHHLRFRIRS
jgi:hypothetical protein